MAVGKRTIWTEEMINFLKSNYMKMNNRQLAEALGLKITVTRLKLYELGYKRIEMEYWTEEQINTLKEKYKIWGDVEIAEYFNKHFPKKKGWTKKHIEKKRRYLNLKRTRDEKSTVIDRNIKHGRYSKKHYLRWLGRRTKIGTVKVWKYHNGDSVPVIRINPKDYPDYYLRSNYFIKLSYYNWTQAFGIIPKGKLIIHKNHDTLDCNIENLECIDRVEAGARLIDNDRYIASRIFFRDKDKTKQSILIKERPDLIEAKKNQLKLGRRLDELTKKA